MAPCLALFLIWAGASVFLRLEPVNGVQQLPGDLSGSLAVSPAGGSKVFAQGPPDLVRERSGPWLLSLHHGSPWPSRFWFLSEHCSLNADYIGRWKYCSRKDFARCYFPFIYHNKVYNNCTTLGSFNGKLWCSLSPNYDEDKVWK
ncbi:seminal plasma protein PDC-109-like [Vicugna pacos]|uniref:Seminal plasma protein PDC-109-like n=1 Tax=Vicugna pacos TaxID=30538 RepID=A0A6J0AMY3_VICPA|nr:seminal plasma protein PDC-109-like [Vicugna pacos]